MGCEEWCVRDDEMTIRKRKEAQWGCGAEPLTGCEEQCARDDKVTIRKRKEPQWGWGCRTISGNAGFLGKELEVQRHSDMS